jgi:hypothetical protein
MDEQNQSPIPKIEVINLKHLEKPLTKLIESVSKAVGGYYKSIGIVRVAKAQAEANLILAHAKVEEQEIALRAAERLAFTEMRRQKNIDAITEAAPKYLPESVDEKPVSEDWMIQFFQQAQDVGEFEMQQLWAKILAGEVSKPGSFSRRTLERVRTMNKEEAEMFTNLCRTVWDLGDGLKVRINEEIADKFDNQIGLNAYALNHLKSIGLLEDSIWYSLEKLDSFSAQYFSQVFTLTWPNGKPVVNDDDFPSKPFTATPLTDVGFELAMIASCAPLENFAAEIMGEIAKEFEMVVTVTPA